MDKDTALLDAIERVLQRGGRIEIGTAPNGDPVVTLRTPVGSFAGSGPGLRGAAAQALAKVLLDMPPDRRVPERRTVTVEIRRRPKLPQPA